MKYEHLFIILDFIKSSETAFTDLFFPLTNIGTDEGLISYSPKHVIFPHPGV